MLALALLPTVSRAMAFAEGFGQWAEVCTSDGMKRVLATDAVDTPLPAASHLDHCAFCALSSDGAAPLASRPMPSWLPVSSAQTPSLFLQAAHTLFAWRSAQPRGPPVLA